MLALLGNHSKIYPIPQETGIFQYKTLGVRIRTFLSWDKQTALAGKQRCVEKTPAHIHHIERIFEYFPRAQIVILLRDGRDVACSLRARHGSLIDGIRRWIDDNRAGQRHWDDPRVLVVRYEELVKTSEEVTERICNFLRVPFERTMLDISRTERRWYSDTIARPISATEQSHNAHRNWQINQPIFDGSGRWRSEMSDEDLELFSREAGRYMNAWGYS